MGLLWLLQRWINVLHEFMFLSVYLLFKIILSEYYLGCFTYLLPPPQQHMLRYTDIRRDIVNCAELRCAEY